MGRIWAKNLQLSEKTIPDDSKICELHFSQYDFTKKKDEVFKRRRIRKTAIPK